MSSQFVIREYEPRDMSSVLALLRLGLGSGLSGKWDENFWQWKHAQNPFGPSITFVATNSTEQIIGLMAFMQWRFKAGSMTIRAVRATDAVTHPDYRRHGVFSALTHRAVEQLRASGFNLIFTTPNNQVLPGYMKWGWNFVSVIKPLIKVLNYPRFAAGLILNHDERTSSSQLLPEKLFRHRFPSMAEFIGYSGILGQLLHSHSQSRGSNLVTDLSLDYLRWRYSEYPYTKYAILYKKRRTLSGCAILRPNKRFGLNEVVLSELLLSQPDEDLASSFLDEMRRSVSADYIIAYFPQGSFERNMLRKHGFHQVPKDGMKFVVNTLAPNLPRDPQDLGNWGLGLGDLEIF